MTAGGSNRAEAVEEIHSHEAAVLLYQLLQKTKQKKTPPGSQQTKKTRLRAYRCGGDHERLAAFHPELEGYWLARSAPAAAAPTLYVEAEVYLAWWDAGLPQGLAALQLFVLHKREGTKRGRSQNKQKLAAVEGEHDQRVIGSRPSRGRLDCLPAPSVFNLPISSPPAIGRKCHLVFDSVAGPTAPREPRRAGFDHTLHGTRRMPQGASRLVM